MQIIHSLYYLKKKGVTLEMSVVENYAALLTTKAYKNLHAYYNIWTFYPNIYSIMSRT